MAPSVDAGFTGEVRQELARLPTDSPHHVRAELSAVLHHAGTLTVPGGGRGRLSLEVTTTSGAVARRAFVLVQHRYGLRADLLVRAPGGMRRSSTYGIRLTAEARSIASDLGVLDTAGSPIDGLPPWLADSTASAYLRGAFLASGSISTPGRAPHLEIVTSGPGSARELAELARGIVDGTVTATESGRRSRVVLKSGATIGHLLAAMGASKAFLTWDDRRLRRELRSDANRLANADAANLRRSVEAAAAQVAAVERALERVGWEGLDDDLRSVALARLANPAASLSELGQLVDPPVGKSVVHRRLHRLQALSTGGGGRPDGV